jgi:hypothetical protein
VGGIRHCGKAQVSWQIDMDAPWGGMIAEIVSPSKTKV